MNRRGDSNRPGDGDGDGGGLEVGHSRLVHPQGRHGPPERHFQALKIRPATSIAGRSTGAAMLTRSAHKAVAKRVTAMKCLERRIASVPLAISPHPPEASSPAIALEF